MKRLGGEMSKGEKRPGREKTVDQFFRLIAITQAFLVHGSFGILCKTTFFENLPTLPLKLWHSKIEQ
ncbi:hypothetical protein DPMN_180683 [Dreissena polymorpha]|uniref:Uncharacterized protein n=1 Tax=Dreissena polymorpha TaxID=45954 RepID=A0A9D4EIH8_DREPO|nr:hypothetical protein DPMN_180683 [Dreissena polymorpha]